MNKKKTLITLIALILFLSVVAVTYGFVVKELNNNRQNVGVGTANVTLTYTDCSSTNTADCANISAQLEPGDSITKTFEITNTGTGEATYTLYFTEILNTFKNDELVYKIEDLESGQLVVSETPVPYNETESNNAIAMEGNKIAVGETKRFKMTITFLNKEYDQAENLNAEFKLKLGLNKLIPANKTLTALNSSLSKDSPDLTKSSPKVASYTDNNTNGSQIYTLSMASYKNNYFAASSNYTFNTSKGLYSLSSPERNKFSAASLKGKYIVDIHGTAGQYGATTDNLIKLYKVEESTTNDTLYYSETSVTANYDANIHPGIFETEDDYGICYYYRGAVTNNYVKFGKWSSNWYRGYQSSDTSSDYKEYSTQTECQNAASFNIGCNPSPASGKDMYWRIVRINGDGSLRMIYDGTSAHANGEASKDRTVGVSLYNEASDTDNIYMFYMYGIKGASNYNDANNNINNSTLKDYIDKWYEKNINGTNYVSFISDEIFCNDRTLTGDGYGYGNKMSFYGATARINGNNKYQYRLTCSQKNDAFTVSDTTNGNGALTYPVGLLTADEMALAGGAYMEKNPGYYLYKGYNYWSISPGYFYPDNRMSIFAIYEDGQISTETLNEKFIGVAPVINLSPSAAQSLIGTGTMTDPYRLPE